MNRSKILFALCAFIFVGLCLFHYASARPLWLDEDFVYQNILHHGYLDLFAPLDPVQSFPRLYLICIKAFSANFDNSVLALRFFSLLAMLGAFFLLMKLVRADSRDELTALLVLFAVAVSYKFSYYAAELKPYSMDLLVVAIYAYYFHHQRIFESAAPKTADYLAAAALPLLMLFSYASLFVFWIAGFNFLLQLGKNRRVGAILLLNAGASLACFLLFYYVDIRHSVTAPGVEYWDGHFISYASFEGFWDKFGDGIRRMVIYSFDGNKPMRYAASIFIPFFVFASAIFGLSRLRKDGCKVYHSDSLTLLLFAELFILGSLQLYPFTGERLTLFFSPFVIYMVVKGMMGFAKQPFLRKGLIGYFLIFYLICLVRTIYLHLAYYTPAA